MAQLHWSHELIRSQIIPASQLYPKAYKIPGRLRIFPFQDINTNSKYEVGEPLINDGQIVIHSGTDTIYQSLNGQPVETYLQPGIIDLHIDEDKIFLTPSDEIPSQLKNISINSADSVDIFIPFVLKENTIDGVAWTIKPNPIANHLRMYYQNKIETEVTLSLRSIQGSEIFSDQVYLEGPYGIIERDIGDLASGIYLFTVEINGRRKTERFIKQ